MFTDILRRATLDDEATAHMPRHTIATTLVRGGTDLAIVAKMLGHARLDQTRQYTLPTDEDRRRVLDLFPVDRRAGVPRKILLSANGCTDIPSAANCI